MIDTLVQKLLIGIPLFYSLWIVIGCPCGIVPSCHIYEFFLGIGGAVFVAIALNSKIF